MKPAKPQTLTIKVGDGRELFINVPNCDGLSRSEGRGAYYYSYWERPVIVSGSDHSQLHIHSERMEAILEEHGIDELGLEVSRVE
ncbi:MAG: hypothetical protein RID07_06460 [Lacipirellulaceae bacterium]